MQNDPRSILLSLLTHSQTTHCYLNTHCREEFLFHPRTSGWDKVLSQQPACVCGFNVRSDAHTTVRSMTDKLTDTDGLQWTPDPGQGLHSKFASNSQHWQIITINHWSCKLSCVTRECNVNKPCFLFTINYKISWCQFNIINSIFTSGNVSPLQILFLSTKQHFFLCEVPSPHIQYITDGAYRTKTSWDSSKLGSITRKHGFIRPRWLKSGTLFLPVIGWMSDVFHHITMEVNSFTS